MKTPAAILTAIMLMALCGCPAPRPAEPPAQPVLPEPPAPPVQTVQPEAPAATEPIRELVILDSLDWSAKFLEAGGLSLIRSDGSVHVEVRDAARAADVLTGACLALRRRMTVICENVANSETTRAVQAPDVPPAPYRRRVLTVTASGALEVTEDRSGFRRVYRPDHPDADSEGNVQLPNVYVEVEMLDWRASCREYEVLRMALAMLSPRHIAPPASLLPEPVSPKPALAPTAKPPTPPAKPPVTPPAAPPVLPVAPKNP